MNAPQLVEAALAGSHSDGCVVLVEACSEVNVRWARCSMTTNGAHRGSTMTVIGVRERAGGHRVGIASGSVTSEADALAVVHRADQAARASPPAEDASPLVAPYVVDDDWDRAVPETGPAVFEGLVCALAGAFARWRDQDRDLFGFAEHRMTTWFMGTSSGLRRRFDQPDGRFELTGRSNHPARSVWRGRYAPDVPDLDVAAEVERLEQDLARGSADAELPPGRYETILSPAAVADLMICAYRHAAARDAEEGRSAFAGLDRGARLSPQPLTLYSDPREPGLECPPFDIVTAGSSTLQSVFDNGQPASRTAWVDRGRLGDLVRPRSWARRTGAAPRPPIDNLILDGGGSATLAEMIASTERALVVTSLWYIRDLDPRTLLVTGLTRDGVYLVEDGAITAAVNNFRFNESPLSLLQRVSEVGRTERALPRERADAFRRTAMPALRVPDFLMSSKSAAV